MALSANRLTTSVLVIAALFTIGCVFDTSGMGAPYKHKFTGCFTGTEWGGIVLYLRAGSDTLLIGDLSVGSGPMLGDYTLDGAEKSVTLAKLTAHKPDLRAGIGVTLVLVGGTSGNKTITLQMDKEAPAGPLGERKLSACTS